MPERVLITGGAGFIGRHLAQRLLEDGHRVRVLDNLNPQVHGDTGPSVLCRGEVELLVGDIRDEDAVCRACDGIDSVVHLAAEIGIGQSMYAVQRYSSVNDYGTAVLFQCLIDKPIRRVVVASSMSIYGEGLYRTVDGAFVDNVTRAGRNADGSWDPLDAFGRMLLPVPTPETKMPVLKSVYAINKFMQERLTLTLTAQYGMEGVALRLWNVYGPGQALSNPYTGVLAIFASRIANGQPPLVFEDGGQRRDFVHVADAVEAFVLALQAPAAVGEALNIGSGADHTILDVARLQAAAMGRSDIAPLVTQQLRAGDIRHCLPDLRKASERLGYRARRDLARGLEELADWVARQDAHDHVIEAQGELQRRGLVA
jgi:dTDP-L-rhamnose 4-epimerase